MEKIFSVLEQIWTMLLTWRLFLINFEAFNVFKDYAEIRCAENISARLDSAWHAF